MFLLHVFLALSLGTLPRAARARAPYTFDKLSALALALALALGHTSGLDLRSASSAASQHMSQHQPEC